ncbi:MAG: hypothetical protein ACTS3R_13295 [Inquilinaceae bacterium]
MKLLSRGTTRWLTGISLFSIGAGFCWLLTILVLYRGDYDDFCAVDGSQPIRIPLPRFDGPPNCDLNILIAAMTVVFGALIWWVPLCLALLIHRLASPTK